MTLSQRFKDEKKYAYRLMHQAFKSGALMRPAECERCGGDNGGRTLHAHHWHGYDDAHAADVIFLCVGCHNREHARNPDCIGRTEAAQHEQWLRDMRTAYHRFGAFLPSDVLAALRAAGVIT